jgi:hypothetical protein
VCESGCAANRMLPGQPHSAHDWTRARPVHPLVVPAGRGRATQLGGIWHGSQESQSGNPAGRTAPPVGIEGIEPSPDRDPRPRKRYAASPGLHNRRSASGDRTAEVRVSTEAAWPGSQCRLPGLALA